MIRKMTKIDDYKSNKTTIGLIDNYTRNFPTDRIERIKSIIRDNFKNIDVRTIHYSELNFSKLEGISGYILSGSKSNVSEFYSNENLRNEYEQVVKLIQQKNQKPILAICYGHQLTSYAFDAKVQRMSEIIEGSRIIPLSLKETDEIISQDEILVNIQHQDFVSPEDQMIKKQFKIIAIKEVNGYKTIQYMRHSNRPIFSVQFHPETHHLDSKFASNHDKQEIDESKSRGEEIIKNFINFCIEKDIIEY